VVLLEGVAMYSEREYKKGVRKRQKDIRDFDRQQAREMARMKKRLGIKKV